MRLAISVAIREEAAEVLRSLIDRIELRGDGKSVDAVLHLRRSHG